MPAEIPKERGKNPNIGAFMFRIGSWGPFYYNFIIRNPPK